MEGLACNPNEKCEDKNMDSNLNILESSQNDEFPLKVTSALTRPFPVQTKKYLHLGKFAFAAIFLWWKVGESVE